MIVLDTNIVSFIFGGDDRARYYLERIQGRRAIISFQTLEEMWYGAYSNGWGERRRSELARYLDQFETVWDESRIDAHLRPLAERTEISRPEDAHG